VIELLTTEETIGSAVRIALGLVAAVVVYVVVTRATARAIRGIQGRRELGPTEGQKRLKTLGAIVRYAALVVLGMLVAAGVLHELGVDIRPFLGTVGITGIVVGLAAQNVIRDYLSGVLVLAENQYAVDDVIRVEGVTGRVEKVTLRTTQLRDVEGNAHIIPNGAITKVTNLTKEWTRILLDVGVAYKEDVDRVIEVLRGLCAEFADDPEWSPLLLDVPEVLGVQELGESAVTVRVVGRTHPEPQWEVKRELWRRIKNRFDAEGIEIQFPHRTLYVGSGESAALRVALHDRDADGRG
jgi:small conductance mechanosensitive channel